MDKIKVIYLFQFLTCSSNLNVCKKIELEIFNPCISKYQLLRIPKYRSCNAVYKDEFVNYHENFPMIQFIDYKKTPKALLSEKLERFYTLYVYGLRQNAFKNLVLIVNIDEKSLSNGYVFSASSTTYFRNIFPPNYRIILLLLLQPEVIMVDIMRKIINISDLSSFWKEVEMCNSTAAVFQVIPSVFVNKRQRGKYQTRLTKFLLFSNSYSDQKNFSKLFIATVLMKGFLFELLF